ncbi:GNAT family N-acetyltransferase [Paenibacillus sp. P26]|nr:GNAT family N-acetyltransferase [Paenibacillus sp. P26]
MSPLAEIQIRDAGEQDREAIRKLMLEAYEQYATVLSKERWEQYRDSISASVEGEGPSARIVAVLDGEVVGAVQMYLSSEEAYGRPELEIHSPIIRSLAVSPKARGRGIATALIKESVRRSLELGASELHLHTSDMMEAAVRLYERLGFERAHDKEFHNGETLVKCYRLQLKEAILKI